MEAAAGLIVYGVTTLEKRPDVGQCEYADYTRKLVEEGVPKAICDMLFCEVHCHEQRPAQDANAYPRRSPKMYLDGAIKM